MAKPVWGSGKCTCLAFVWLQGRTGLCAGVGSEFQLGGEILMDAREIIGFEASQRVRL
jgi:hypothetical protein